MQHLRTTFHIGDGLEMCGTYDATIRGMNIHLPPFLIFTREHDLPHQVLFIRDVFQITGITVASGVGKVGWR